MVTGPVRSALRRALWNARERRPRMPVRVSIATAAVVLSILGLGVVVQSLFTGAEPRSVRIVASILAQGSPILVILVLAVVIDRREVRDLGLGFDRDWWVDLGFGAVLGAVLMSGIFVVALGLGWVRVTGLFSVQAAGMGFGAAFVVISVFFVVAGFSEELLLRGYLLTNLAEGVSAYLSQRSAVGVAMVLSSVVFGAAHLGNPNATFVSTLGISLAGLLLAAGYVLTGDLAISTGVHVTWNLFQGPVFGFAVSGVGFGVSLVETTETGPDLATGGSFGPEAGLLGVVAIGAGILAIAGYVRHRYGILRVNDRLTRPALRWRDQRSD